MNAKSSIAVLIAACGIAATASAVGDEAQGARSAQAAGSSGTALTAAPPGSNSESDRDASTRPATESTQSPAPQAVAPAAATNAADSNPHDNDGSGSKGSDALSTNVIDDGQLGGARGGSELQPVNLNLNQNNSTGSVSGNVATNLTTGTNNISDSAFSNSAGVPVVIQNTGNNVLIQNSTILNVQLAPPK